MRGFWNIRNDRRKVKVKYDSLLNWQPAAAKLNLIKTSLEWNLGQRQAGQSSTPSVRGAQIPSIAYIFVLITAAFLWHDSLKFILRYAGITVPHIKIRNPPTPLPECFRFQASLNKPSSSAQCYTT